MLNINISTPTSILHEFKSKYKQKRLELDLTQEGLASKSGMSLGSLKRFEASGQIAFESLLKLSLVLECLEDFKQILAPQKQMINSIDELLEKKEKSKKRGSIK